MGGDDPHIHVEAKTVHRDAAVRDVTAATFGLVADLPSRVETGCGLRVPYAMTSPRPGSVTCLACRDHARVEHLRFADEVERLGAMPGSAVTAAQAKLAADRHRELAEEFSGADG